MWNSNFQDCISSAIWTSNVISVFVRINFFSSNESGIYTET